jgi:hypothetical protein
MKAFTVRQPWAWALVMGYKDVENRSRRTNHRGPILVHAAKQMDPEGFQLLWELGLYGKLPADLPTGGLVGQVEIVDCITNSDSPWAQSNSWHWVIRKPQSFNSPLTCNGSLGLFEPDVSGPALGQTLRHAVSHRQRVP